MLTNHRSWPSTQLAKKLLAVILDRHRFLAGKFMVWDLYRSGDWNWLRGAGATGLWPCSSNVRVRVHSSVLSRAILCDARCWRPILLDESACKRKIPPIPVISDRMGCLDWIIVYLCKHRAGGGQSLYGMHQSGPPKPVSTMNLPCIWPYLILNPVRLCLGWSLFATK